MDQTNFRQRRWQQTDNITGPQSHIQSHEKLKRKKLCGEKSVHGSREHLSVCPVSQYYHAMFSFTDVFNQPAPFFFIHRVSPLKASLQLAEHGSIQMLSHKG